MTALALVAALVAVMCGLLLAGAAVERAWLRDVPLFGHLPDDDAEAEG